MITRRNLLFQMTIRNGFQVHFTAPFSTPVDILFLFDTSNSMVEPMGHGSGLTKLEAAIQIGCRLIKNLPPDYGVGVAQFSDTAQLVAPVSRDRERRHELTHQIGRFRCKGWSDYGEGYFAALNALLDIATAKRFQVVLLFGDGQMAISEPRPERAPLVLLKTMADVGIMVAAIGFGEGEDIDDPYLRTIVTKTFSGAPNYVHGACLMASD